MSRYYASIGGSVGLLSRQPRQLAERAVSTQLLLTRSALESNLIKSRRPDSIPVPLDPRMFQAFQALSLSLEKSNIGFCLTERENSLMKKDAGTWDMIEDVIDLDMRWESLGMLLWSLRIFKDLPSFCSKFPREEMYKATSIIPAFPDTIDTFLDYFTTGEGTKTDHVVNPEDLRFAIAQTEAWFWRSRAQVVLDLKDSLKEKTPENKLAKKNLPSGLAKLMTNIDKAILAGTERALADGLIRATTDGDFQVFDGIAYGDMGDHEIRDTARLAEARMNALGWMCGSHEWDYEVGNVSFINPMGSLWSP